MRVAILFAAAIFTVVDVYSHDCENVQCPLPPRHYEDFSCKPIMEPHQCCPLQYDCSLEDRDPTKCHFNNTTFDIGESYSSADLEASCTTLCVCREADDDHSVAQFHCSHNDCLEFLNVKVTDKSCVQMYKFESCCIDKTVCGDEVKSLAKCEFDGRTYYEGELMESNSCYSCICGEGFEEKPVEENKHCRKVECAMEIHYYEKMMSGCIPIYFQTDDCCPLEWRCPDDSTTVIPKETIAFDEKNSDLTCSFGNLTMNLGDSLSPEIDSDDCTTCKCELPPHPTCIRTCATT